MPRLPIALLLAALSFGVLADQRADTLKQLDAARQDIKELQTLLKRLQEEKSGVQKQLKQTESEMGTLEKQVDELQNQLKDSESELQRLDDEKARLEGSRQDQQRLIGVQARAAYQSGSQEYLKLLLNQQNPDRFSRTLTYYDYLARARFEQIDRFNSTIRQLASVQQQIDEERTRLTERKDMLDSHYTELEALRGERQQALAKLNTDLSARDQRLKARQQEQAQLNQVLKTIEETLARQAREAEEARQRALTAQRQQQERTERSASAQASGPMVSSSGSYGGPFSQAKGKLPWPVNGRLIARFGAARGDDDRSKWDGVLIGTSAGSTVRAVYGGRVVFADWLRGAGLLVILDHGNGYLSLYGHNQSLLKDAGDLVEAGEPIATVGTSGGQEQPALYFAIRQQGRPSDPSAWCRAQG